MRSIFIIYHINFRIYHIIRTLRNGIPRQKHDGLLYRTTIQ